MSDAAHLPIDIQSSKLTDWLVSRRVCDRHWVRDAADVRRRIAQLTASDSLGQEGVSAELQAALRQPQVHFWHCERIADALKRLDSANKSFLFGYSSAVIRELDAILKLYKRGGCYLADAARLLTKLVQEEAPLLKRQAERARRRQAECERRKGELAASSAEARVKFSALCRQFSLNVDDAQNHQHRLSLGRVRRELIGQAEALPDWFDGACMSTLRALSDPVRLYGEFAEQQLAAEDGADSKGKLCATLNYLLTRGNTTQFEFLRGRPPARVEPYVMTLPADLGEIGVEDDTAAAAQDSEAAGDGAIDFGGETAIDFSVVESGETDTNYGDAGVIDFSGIEEITEAALGEATTETPAISDVDGVARGDQARSVLDTLDLRERLLDDLHELDAFYSRLVVELGDHANCVSQLVLAASPASAPIPDFGSQVRGAISLLTDPSRQQLMLMRSAPTFLNRLLGRFAALSDQADKATAASRLLEERRLEAEDEERQIAQQLAALRAQICELKALIEGEISRRCDNRRVNIMGEVYAV